MENTRNHKWIYFWYIGVNLGYLISAYHNKTLQHDTWMEIYGDYVPQKTDIFNTKIRTWIRKFRFYVHYWKLVSSYNFKKYDTETVTQNTGYDSAYELDNMSRRYEYYRKRDTTFDFMQIGEDDFEVYNDNMP